MCDLEGVLVESSINYANEIVDVDKDIIFLSDKTSVHDLERFSPTKRRMSGSFATTSINALTQFAKSIMATDSDVVEQPCCFVGEGGKAQVIFNFGSAETPLHQDLTANISLGKTPVFKAIENIRDERLTQKELAEFIEDFHSYTTALDRSGEEINQSVAISAIRNISIESNSSVNQKTEGYKDTSSAFASVEAKFEAATPAYLKFNIPAFNEIDEREFIFRISVITSEDRIKLSLRCPNWDEVIESINIEFQEKLSEKLNPMGIQTFIGRWG